MKWIKINKTLSAILLLTFIASAGYSFYFRINPVVDSDAYEQIAINLIEGKGFKEDATLPYQFDKSILRAGPGYEFFIAGLYKVFGQHHEAIWIAQALLHVVSVFFIYLIVQRIFKTSEYKKQIGILSAFLFGLNPDLIEIGAMLMTETLYLFFTILVIYIFLKVYDKPRSFLLGSALGIITGVSILTRPPILLFIPIFLFFYWREKQYKTSLIFLASLVVSLAPWVYRNFLIYDQFILTTLIGEYNLWVGNTTLSNGGQISGEPNPVIGHVTEYGVFTLKKATRSAFFMFVFQEPLVFIKLVLIRAMRYASLIRPMGFWFYQTGVSQGLFILSSLVSIGILFTTGISGMVKAWQDKLEIIRYLIVLAVTAPILLLPTVVQSRYRFQIYPFLAIFGAYLIIEFYKKRKKQDKLIFIKITTILAIISFIDALIFTEIVTARLSKFLPFL